MHLWELHESGSAKALEAVGSAIESLLSDGSENVKELAVVGILEVIQNSWANNGTDPDGFARYLGSLGLRSWSELNKGWGAAAQPEPTPSSLVSTVGTMRSVILSLLAMTMSLDAFAHGGGLDRNGCHTNRKTGDYHCHRGSAPSRDASTPDSDSASGHSGRSGAFANCAQARAAGAAPVRRGDQGYGPHLDRDNDGIGCEPYRGRR